MSPQKAYAQAEAECRTLDPRAHLAIITSQAEMDAIDDLIQPGQCYLMLYFGRIIIMWLGTVVAKPRLKRWQLTLHCQLRRPSASYQLLCSNHKAISGYPSHIYIPNFSKIGQSQFNYFQYADCTQYGPLSATLNLIESGF